MPIGPFLIFFFALSVLSHISNHILYRYLYMSAGVTSRCMPLVQESVGDTCVCCGKKAKHMIYWGVAY